MISLTHLMIQNTPTSCDQRCLHCCIENFCTEWIYPLHGHTKCECDSHSSKWAYLCQCVCVCDCVCCLQIRLCERSAFCARIAVERNKMQHYSFGHAVGHWLCPQTPPSPHPLHTHMLGHLALNATYYLTYHNVDGTRTYTCIHTYLHVPCSLVMEKVCVGGQERVEMWAKRQMETARVIVSMDAI